MRNLHLTFILCVTCLLLAATHQSNAAVGIHVKVRHLSLGGLVPAQITVDHGLGSAAATLINSDYETEYHGWYDETGYWHQGYINTGQWAEYSVWVGDEWANKSACLSFDQISWSSLYRIGANPGEVASFDINASLEFPNAFVGTVGNPSSYITPQGNIIPVGRWWNDAEHCVFTLSAWDNALPSWPCVGMDSIASTENAYWRWIHSGVIAMELDYLHRVTLRKLRNPNFSIVLDPELGRITVNGSRVLTEASGIALLAPSFVSRTAAGVNLAVNGTAYPQPGGKPQLVLGSFNDNRTTFQGSDRTTGVLVVGTGSSAPNGTITRQNGLRILDDGTVLIQPRGGLQMTLGVFDKGPQP